MSGRARAKRSGQPSTEPSESRKSGTHIHRDARACDVGGSGGAQRAVLLRGDAPECQAEECEIVACRGAPSGLETAVHRGMETLESSGVCRLCGQHSAISINIFDESENHVRKINAVLPIMVRHYAFSLSLSLSRSHSSSLTRSFLPSRPLALPFFALSQRSPFADSLLRSREGTRPRALRSSVLAQPRDQWASSTTLLPSPSVPSHLIASLRNAGPRSLYHARFPSRALLPPPSLPSPPRTATLFNAPRFVSASLLPQNAARIY